MNRRLHAPRKGGIFLVSVEPPVKNLFREKTKDVPAGKAPTLLCCVLSDG